MTDQPLLQVFYADGGIYFRTRTGAEMTMPRNDAVDLAGAIMLAVYHYDEHQKLIASVDDIGDDEADPDV